MDKKIITHSGIQRAILARYAKDPGFTPDEVVTVIDFEVEGER